MGKFGAFLRAAAEASERQSRWEAYVASLYPMRAAWNEGDYGKLKELLDASAPKPGEAEVLREKARRLQALQETDAAKACHAEATRLAESLVRGKTATPTRWRPWESLQIESFVIAIHPGTGKGRCWTMNLIRN